MNATNILNFITRANLTGINAINAQLQQQAAALANITRQAAAQTAAARRLQQAWAQAGRAAQAQAQNRTPGGQFAPGMRQQVTALAQARAFAAQMRTILSSAWRVNTAAWSTSIRQSLISIEGQAMRLARYIDKALSWRNVGNALKRDIAVAATALASLMTNAAKIAGSAIRTFIGGALAAAQKAASALAGIIRNIKGGIGNLGVGGALVSIAGIKAGYTVDKMLAKINTIARETKPNLDLIAQGLERIAFTTGTTFSDNAEAYYDLLSAGLGVKDGVVQITTSLNLMQDAANLAVGGIGSMKDSLDFMTTALNAFRGPLTEEFGDPLKASTKIADAFAKSVELGKTTVAELAPVFSTAAPLAAQLGVDWREMAAILAAMTQQGFDAGETFTALRSALVGTQRNSKALQKALKDIDVKRVLDQFGAKTWLDLIDKGGFAVFAETLRAYSEKTGVPLIKMLGRIEGVQAILGTTGAQAENYAYILEQVTESEGNAAEQAALFNDSLSAQLNLFKNSLFAIGDALFRRRIIDPLKDFVRTLNEIAGSVFQWVIANEKLFDVFIPLFTLFTGLAALTKGASAIENIFLRLGGPISGFAIGIGRIGAAIAWTTGPILAIIVAFTTFQRLIEFGILPARYFGVALSNLTNIFNNLLTVGSGVVTLVTGIVDAIANARIPSLKIDNLFREFGETASGALDRATALLHRFISNMLAGFADFFDEEFQAQSKAIGDSIWNGMVGIFDYLAPRIADTLGQLLTFGAEVVTNFVEFGAGIAAGIGQAIIDALPKAAEFISGVPAAIGDALEGGGALTSVKTQLGEWWQSLIDWFKVHGPDLADGIIAVFTSIGRVLAVAVPKALGAAGDLLASVFDNIVANKDEILRRVGQLVEGIADVLGTLVDLVVPPLADAAGAFIDWIAVDVIPNVAGAVARFIDEVVRSLVPLGDDVKDSMDAVGPGLIDWIGDRIPGTLRALLDWTIQVENWIITVLLPRVGAAFLAVGLGVVKFLFDGLLAAAQNPGQFITDMAKVVYALLAAGVIIKAAAAAGALVSLAYQAAIYAPRVGFAFLRGFTASLAADLVGAGTAAAGSAGATLGAGLLAATLGAAIGAVVVVVAVALDIQTKIKQQGAALVTQVEEFVKTATVDGLRAAKAALAKASADLDMYLDFGIVTGSARVDIQRMNDAIDAALLAAGEKLDPRPLPLQISLKPNYTAMLIDPPDKRAELQAYIDQHPYDPVTVETPVHFALTGDTPEEVRNRIRELTKKFDITETVTKFKEGTSALVDEWNNFPDRLKTTQELLTGELFNPDGTLKSFDLGPTVTQFQQGYQLIQQAMDSGNPKAIVRAQQLAAEMTQMAKDTNAAFVAAGQAPPFMIDKYTGAVTLASDAAKALSGAVITPVSAIPPAFTAAGDAAGTVEPAIIAATPGAAGAALGFAGAIKAPLTPLPGIFSGLGTDTADNFVANVKDGIVPAGLAGAALGSAVHKPLTPLPGIFTGLGKSTAGNFVTGVKDKIPAAGAAGRGLKGAATYPLKPTAGWLSTLKSWGRNIAQAWVNGIVAKLGVAGATIGAAMAAALAAGMGSSPPKTGPLHHIDVWGSNVGKAWVDGLVSGLETAPARVAAAIAAAGAVMTDTASAEYALAYATSGQPSRLNRDVTVRHMVKFDGQAPPGVTEAGVAGYLQRGLDASGLMRNLKHATGVR